MPRTNSTQRPEQRRRLRRLAVTTQDVVAASAAASHVGAATTTSEQAEAVDPSVLMYALDYSVSQEEAARRLDRIQPLHELTATIRDVETERLAGWGIDHSPTFAGWVLLTGAESPAAKAAAIARNHADLEIRTGAMHTYAELLRAKRALRDIGPVGQVDDPPGPLAESLGIVTFTAVDMAANAVEIGIDPTLNADSLFDGSGVGAVAITDEMFQTGAAAFRESLMDHIDVAFTVADGRGLTPHTDFIGGQPITTCTGGFTALRGAQYGVVTAGHCPDIQSMNRIALEFVYGYQSLTADAQFHAIPSGSSHVLKDNYLCGAQSDTECDVLGRRSRLTMMGDFVCHTGKRSGTTCGTVNRIDLSPEYEIADACLNDKKEPATCSDVFVQVTGDYLRQCKGDSGGPWFRRGVAYGLHMGGTDGPCTQHGVSAHFSAILEVERFLELSILTLDDVAVP